jgi:hypothetical protein
MGAKVGYDIPERRAAYWETPEPIVTTFFDDSHGFEVGGRRFELYSVPGGETRDCPAVWLPQERTVFTSNLMGALYGQLPHLQTIRGDRPRSARSREPHEAASQCQRRPGRSSPDVAAGGAQLRPQD